MGRESRTSQAAMTHHIAYRQSHQPPSWQEQKQGLANTRFVSCYCVGETALLLSTTQSSSREADFTFPLHRMLHPINEALKFLFKHDDEFKARLGQNANEQNRRQALTKTA